MVKTTRVLKKLHVTITKYPLDNFKKHTFLPLTYLLALLIPLYTNQNGKASTPHLRHVKVLHFSETYKADF